MTGKGGGQTTEHPGVKGQQGGGGGGLPQAAAETSVPQGTVAPGSCGLEETLILPA